jgi:two-component sensor histidine kinase
MIVTVRDVTAGWQQEEALRQALADKNTLLNELYHRVKNNLQLIISLFDLQVRTVQDPRAQQALIEAMGRVRAMALVHERLNQSHTVGSIALHAYIGELCDQLARAASAQQRAIAVQLDLSPLDVGLDIAVPLGLLLNELVTNSLKHAFPNDRGGTIRVTLAPDAPAGEQGRADAPCTDHCLIVHDNGIGLPHDANRTSTETLGLRLVGALSDGLHARLTLENRHGACITVAFRVPGACCAPESPQASVVESAPKSTQQ